MPLNVSVGGVYKFCPDAAPNTEVINGRIPPRVAVVFVVVAAAIAARFLRKDISKDASDYKPHAHAAGFAAFFAAFFLFTDCHFVIFCIPETSPNRGMIK